MATQALRSTSPPGIEVSFKLQDDCLEDANKITGCAAWFRRHVSGVQVCLFQLKCDKHTNTSRPAPDQQPDQKRHLPWVTAAEDQDKLSSNCRKVCVLFSSSLKERGSSKAGTNLENRLSSTMGLSSRTHGLLLAHIITKGQEKHLGWTCCSNTEILELRA